MSGPFTPAQEARLINLARTIACDTIDELASRGAFGDLPVEPVLAKMTYRDLRAAQFAEAMSGLDAFPHREDVRG